MVFPQGANAKFLSDGLLQISYLTGLVGFSGFRFAPLALFAATANSGNPNTTPAVRILKNPLIPQILILTIPPNPRYRAAPFAW